MATALADSDDAESVSVSQLRNNWRVHEDGALAQRLQSEEIAAHLGGNRRRNHQIRDDFPKALEEQNLEARRLEQEVERERQKRLQVELDDEEIAQQLQLKDEQEYQAERDQVFAKRLQQMELLNHRPKVPQPGVKPLVPLEPPPSRTPPLPVLANGDVPTQDDVLPHVRGGVKYNDDQYLVKLARPAVVTAEPVYANNKPEHYAVSNKDLADGGLRSEQMSTLLLGAAGLSQKDVALSKRAEEQLEQERRDARLARMLQDEEQVSHIRQDSNEIEAKDFEYALELQEREKAKLKRAKERAKEKRRLKRLQEEQAQAAATEEERPQSQTGGTSPQPAQQTHRTPPKLPPEVESPDVKPPARKPYMNTQAIDAHQSEFASTDEDKEKEAEEEEQEPRYANVGQPVINLHQDSFGQVTKVSSRRPNVDDEGQIIPPYMPMQQQSSKKSHSLEKRIKKKKEKEGCKQQ